jgi:hypothetical protein
LGYKKDPKNSDKHFISGNLSTLIGVGSDQTLPGLDWIQKPDIQWQKPETIQNLPEAISMPTIKITENDLAITDCKSLYDLTTRTAAPNCQEFRTQLQARAIKDILAEGIQLHWVHSGAQLADALTKVMESTFLRETLKQGKYCLHNEHEVLKNRASARNRLEWLKSSSVETSSC